MKVLWQYLIKRIEAVVDAWGVYLQSVKSPSESVCNESAKQCPFAPILPDKDSLEAMVGDFLEHHEMLIQDDLPLPVKFVSTVAWFSVLVIGICFISLDNYIDNVIRLLKNKTEVTSSDLETDGSE